MLVIISDLHLTDGTTADTVMDPAFDRFQEILIELAEAASKRTAELYQPIERIDMILLGDILDVLRSSYWNDIDKKIARPWNKLDKAEERENLVKALEYITDCMLEFNKKSFEIMRGWSSGKSLRCSMLVTAPSSKRCLEWKYWYPWRNFTQMDV